jgi:hypothetical protein
MVSSAWVGIESLLVRSPVRFSSALPSTAPLRMLISAPGAVRSHAVHRRGPRVYDSGAELLLSPGNISGMVSRTVTPSWHPEVLLPEILQATTLKGTHLM